MPSGHSSRSAGPTAQNDASSGLDGTDRDEKNLGKSLQDLAQPTWSSKDTSRLAPPWQGWKLDSNFLSDLHKWNNLHKDDKLPAVLAKVNGILESKPLEAALEFIPDVPFPAKSFVKAMTSLFLLGSVSDVSFLYSSYDSYVSHPSRKFLKRSRTSTTFRIRSLLISPTWP